MPKEIASKSGLRADKWVAACLAGLGGKGGGKAAMGQGQADLPRSLCCSPGEAEATAAATVSARREFMDGMLEVARATAAKMLGSGQQQ